MIVAFMFLVYHAPGHTKSNLWPGHICSEARLPRIFNIQGLDFQQIFEEYEVLCFSKPSDVLNFVHFLARLATLKNSDCFNEGLKKLQLGLSRRNSRIIIN